MINFVVSMAFMWFGIGLYVYTWYNQPTEEQSFSFALGGIMASMTMIAALKTDQQAL